MSKTAKNDQNWGRFDYLGLAKYFVSVTAVMVLGSLILMGTRGLNYGVDFRGGIEVQVQFNERVDAERVRDFMSAIGFPSANVQAIGEKNEYLLRVESLRGANESAANTYINATVDKIKGALAEKFVKEGASVRQVNTVGPQVGAEMKRNGILAAFYCFLLVLVYVGLRFDYRFAPAAVFCVFHDAIVTVGVYSIFQWEFTIQTLAAVLTIVGYSLNDTIVIFDRIRENVAAHRDKSLFWIANRSVNETMSRTIMTFLTTFIVVATMYTFADGAIKDFAKTLMIGMVLGVYSTVYVATPIMLWIDRWQRSKRQQQLQTA
jgi:preprotein translocase subunit SecF